MIHECEYGPVFVTPCGCELAKCSVCGVIKSTSKCKYHLVGKVSSREYYINGMGCIVEGIPQHTRVSEEMELALGRLDIKPIGSRVLEIGAGLGLYAPMCLRYKYVYEALEIDHWAAQYIRGAYGVTVHELPFERMAGSGNYDIVIAAHVLEHLFDAKKALIKIYDLLKEDGVAFILVPNDEDLCNPDHYWFFNKENIKGWMEEIGFEVMEIVQKRVVLHEQFIYIKATKIKK